ncbi:MAG: aspartate aminotransferase family protein [Janthinobacterium lividum]
MTEHAVVNFGQDSPIVDRAEGVYIYDTNGKQYLDGSAGAMTVSIGHGVREVVDAMLEQAHKASFVYRAQFNNDPAEMLARELAALAPGDINHAFFVNSGSEATELAMRASLQYWRELGRSRKAKILGRRVSYHGMTMGSLSMSGHDLRRKDYGGLLHEFAVAPPIYEYRFPLSGSDADNYGASVWERIIQEQDADTVAAVIVEPIVGAAGGALTPPIGYLSALREICDRHDVLLIVDEVVTGLGRTGRWFACEYDRIVPDMIACGKGMTSGYTPMGGVLFRDRIVEASRQGSRTPPFGHTFSNNPLSAATSLAVLRYMRRTNILDNVALRGAQLEAGLRALATQYPWMADVRGRGLLWGFEFITNARTRAAPDPALCVNTRFVAHCFSAGLNVYPAGIAPYNNAALISPPLNIAEGEIEELLRRLEVGLQLIGKEIWPALRSSPRSRSSPGKDASPVAE